MTDVNRLIGFMAIMQVPFKDDPDALMYIEEVKTALKDYQALVEKMTPRVLTLEEVLEKKPFHLWAEDLDTGALVFPVALVDGEYRDYANDWGVDVEPAVTDYESYGKRWRFWSGKPGNELREETAWELRQGSVFGGSSSPLEIGGN